MIFCVEDDQGIRNMMVYTLKASGFEAKGFDDAASVWVALKDEKPDLILLDIMLPGEDGISLLQRLRAHPATASLPIILASAKGTEYDKVLGLDLGADDYLAKPFGMMEMVSRVRAVLRRSAPVSAPKCLKLGGIEMDLDCHLVRCDSREITLTLKEFDLLKLFMENVGRVFTREKLLEIVWGSDFYGETRTVDVHIGNLRDKLDSHAHLIQTVRGVGYRMDDSGDAK